MRILVLGVTGMIGSAMFRVLTTDSAHETHGTVRSANDLRFFGELAAKQIATDVDVENYDTLVRTLVSVRPEVVVNCVGATKHKTVGNDPLTAIPMNAMLPHRLAKLCEGFGARLIHVSTDCVFSGRQGNYLEGDWPDAEDVYGRTKALGEVDYPHAVTLRTSTIGHELHSSYGLLEWFLTQQNRCQGFRRAVFSGLPSVIFAQIVRDLVIPRRELHGLYHVAGRPIAKSELLKIIASVYEKSIEIVPDDTIVIDRSLNGERFCAATGYQPPDWATLIKTMHEHRQFEGN